MAYKKKKITFEGMTYRKVKPKKSRDREGLTKENQQWLKNNNYCNIGGNNVISLFKKIKDLQEQEIIKKSSLEELFFEADRIGNKYLTSKEINQRNLRIAQELNEIADLIDSQFPDNTVEAIDYSK